MSGGLESFRRMVRTPDVVVDMRFLVRGLDFGSALDGRSQAGTHEVLLYEEEDDDDRNCGARPPHRRSMHGASPTAADPVPPCGEADPAADRALTTRCAPRRRRD